MRSRSIFDDALAFWSMDGLKSVCGTYAMTVYGEVTAGNDLSDAERNDSIARGGDGKTAAFLGGFLKLEQNTKKPLRIGGKI
ncbi:MAG: hypothetical protein AABZ39_19795 [Spirochaetota bacterium]